MTAGEAAEDPGGFAFFQLFFQADDGKIKTKWGLRTRAAGPVPAWVRAFAFFAPEIEKKPDAPAHSLAKSRKRQGRML